MEFHLYYFEYYFWPRNNRDFLLSLLIPAFSDLRMSEDEADTPVAESSIGKALKEQCKLDKDMLGMMKVRACLGYHAILGVGRGCIQVTTLALIPSFCSCIMKV